MDHNIMQLFSKVTVGHLIKMCTQPVKKKSPSTMRRDKARIKAFLEKKDQERRENQHFKEGIKIEPKPTQTVSTVSQIDIASKIEEKDSEISSLKGKIAVLEKELSHLKSAENSEIARLNNEIENFEQLKNAEISSLNRELESNRLHISTLKSDLERTKSELNAQKIEFGEKVAKLQCRLRKSEESLVHVKRQLKNSEEKLQQTMNSHELLETENKSLKLDCCQLRKSCNDYKSKNENLEKAEQNTKIKISKLVEENSKLKADVEFYRELFKKEREKCAAKINEFEDIKLSLVEQAQKKIEKEVEQKLEQVKNRSVIRKVLAIKYVKGEMYCLCELPYKNPEWIPKSRLPPGLNCEYKELLAQCRRPNSYEIVEVLKFYNGVHY